nr:basic proline-rich protein-like [Equus asinus]
MTSRQPRVQGRSPGDQLEWAQSAHGEHEGGSRERGHTERGSPQPARGDGVLASEADPRRDGEARGQKRPRHRPAGVGKLLGPPDGRLQQSRFEVTKTKRARRALRGHPAGEAAQGRRARPGAGPRGPGRCRAARRAGLRDSSQGPGAPPGAKDASPSVWPVLANPGAGAIPTHAPGAAVGRSRVRPKRRDQPSRTRPRRHSQIANSGRPGAPGGQGSAQAAAHVAETPHSPAPHDPAPRDPRRRRPRAGGRAERPRALTVRYRGRPRGRPVAGPSPQAPPPAAARRR